ncbi:uncharacterized protein LOC111711711 isoform X2 [Eurytemora carolleeae]|uniref:uncharacterized protein LOC111711711 isoform X2 n=1 Tax=Eurytemora carolleeae TaxID=1294199 RepID=UPI000C789C36|nr:uncharacterized protein LOC111711711 isoform X2 [Eurytemora carolleeae]|eukprot:XP_023341899.1 uncharacterized protein LOC111711711 isoform X2 [Eurytemora affinis]
MFSELDKSALNWTISKIWEEEMPTDLDTEYLLSLLFPLHRERLPRLLASSLLYCGRYEDTVILECENQPTTKILIISMVNLPNSDPPIALTPGGRLCSRLAILYRWNSQQQPPPQSTTRR